MPLTLAELSKIETDDLRGQVMDTLLMEASILELFPWETIGKLSTTVISYQALPSIGFRKINAGYSEAAGSLEHKTENISLMGLDMDCDIAIARAANTIGDARSIQRKMRLKALAYSFNDKFINGDPTSDPEEFKGIAARVDDIAADYPGQKIALGGTAGTHRDRGILYDTTASHNFLNKLDQLIYSIKGHNPNFLFMNKKMLLALRALLRKEKLLDNTRDMFDRVVDIYQSCRLIDIGVQANQTTEIITNTEDVDGSYVDNLATSIYAVKFGVGEFLWGIQEYPMEVRDLGELESKPVYRDRLDWPLGLAHVDPRSIARLYDIFPDTINKEDA